MTSESKMDYSNPKELERAIKNTKKQMENAAQNLGLSRGYKIKR